ncbi:hypothetical protein [Streptomyces sp. NPDC001492]
MEETEEHERQAADNRIWEHLLHEDNIRYQQGNLFLVALSLLAVAYSTILTAGDKNLAAARVIAAFGIASTLIWLYIGHRHLLYWRAIRLRTRQRLPDYDETLRTCMPRGRSLVLIVYALPGLSAIMWLLLLLIA